ncbi:CHAT domain-containing protein [Cylindrospermum sp. FACHB-282]|uniref:CHAT domain-containing protein n=1 Tax=Cylindrospermum sp. FACHB-282 TaxID=2692794 RepID=UPI0016853DDF|nr:CHAT domain-containing protein [Cylindrospermum sp. FACHB-282]MBD2384062.1 CHAT domain-containing protein [Cylindrospermum sp. FACHB-282]
MNEQRQQAYLQLIDELLSCPNGEEPGILQAHQDLLDADFLQTVEAVAEYFAQQGNENNAGWLRNLATQLRGALNLNMSILDLEAYGQFLLEVLQATADSKGDAQVVYPLLAANTDKLNDTFAKLLHRWATNKFAEAEPDTAASIAGLIVNSSNLIQQFPLGNTSRNMEIAITGYEIALTIVTRTVFRQAWARIQNDLGKAYSERIKGNTAENIEQAIAYYIAALEVRTRIDFSQDWARTQHNLGNAYSKRIKGDTAENIEQAIAHYIAALEFRTRIDFSQDWAETQNSLGVAYSKKIKGNTSENIEQAIAHYMAALQVRNHTANPGQEWADTQNNLGAAYSNRIKGDPSKNIEQAITAYSLALKVRIRTTFPNDWAGTQNNLGNAYRDRIRGDKPENIEQAIAVYYLALEVRTRTDFPQEWADTQNNLGNAYSNRIKGDPSENIEQAIAYYRAALEVRTRTTFPQNHAETLFNLGIVYLDAKQFNSAYSTFASAIETVETLRYEIVSGEESKRKQAEKWNQLYRRMVEVCLALGKETEAIEYVERSKTRNLVELILNRDLKTTFPPDVVTKLEQLRDEIASGQYQIQNGKAENPTVLAQHLQELRQQRNELQNQYLPVGYSFKFDRFQSTLDVNTVIVEWYITFEKIIAIVIKPQGQKITVWQSQSEDRKYFYAWINQYLDDYYRQKDQWQNQLEERLKKLAEILQIEEILTIIPKHCDRLILIPHRFLHLLPLHALPVKESYLLDLFPKGVGYAPSCQLLQQVQLRQRNDFQSLFAIQNPTDDLIYADLEVESIQHYFPADKTTVLRQNDATRNALDINLANLAEVNYLHFSCHGSFNLNTPEDSCLYLNGSILNKQVDLNKCLTLGDLFNKDFNLNQCRLVVLSACETGLIDFNNTSDEYIGLPSGFLHAGSSSVVSSLWTVNDLSTALLMIQFNQNMKQDMTVSIALKEAQNRLRNLSLAQFEQILEDLTPQLDKVLAKLRPGQKLIIKEQIKQIKNRGEKPFSHPYYWAGFTAIGI